MNLKGRASRFFQTVPSDFRYFLIDIRSKVTRDNYLKILILLTITGLILRLWHIGEISFWFDETLTSEFSHQSLLGIVNMSKDTVNPPTFYLIEHAMLYFGAGETILRLIPALVGTCTIPVFYLLGREFNNRKTGIIAATLLTFSSFHIYYSQEARPYTLLLFCFTLALLFYFQALSTDTRSSWLLFGVFSALACWMHFFGFVMVLPLFILALFFKFRSGKTSIMDLKPAILAGAICFLFSLPMILVSLHAGISKVAQDESWGFRGIAMISSTIRDAFGPYYLGVIILSLLFLLGLVQMFYDDRKKFLLITVSFALPLLITVVLSYRMAIVSRYLIGLLPFFFLGISYSFSVLYRRKSRVRISCIMIFLLIALSIPSLCIYYSADSKYGHDWKGLSPELYNMTGTGDTILIFPGYHIVPLTYYYPNGTDQTFVFGIENKTDLEGIVVRYSDQNKMLIVVDSSNQNPEGEIGKWIKTHAVLVKKHEGLYLFRIINSSNPVISE